MSLRLNSLIFYIEIVLLNEVQNFHVQFLRISNGVHNGNSITWVIGSRFGSGIPLWICDWIIHYYTITFSFKTRVSRPPDASSIKKKTTLNIVCFGGLHTHTHTLLISVCVKSIATQRHSQTGGYNLFAARPIWTFVVNAKSWLREPEDAQEAARKVGVEVGSEVVQSRSRNYQYTAKKINFLKNKYSRSFDIIIKVFKFYLWTLFKNRYTTLWNYYKSI